MQTQHCEARHFGDGCSCNCTHGTIDGDTVWMILPLFLIEDVVDVVFSDVVDVEVVEDFSKAQFGLDASAAQVIQGVTVTTFDVGQPCLQCRDATFQGLN